MINSTPNPADALIAALHEPGREHLLDLVRNPLRLTLLCMTWDGSSLPETQAELYARYLRKIYGWNQNWHELEDHAERCGTTTTKLKQNLNRKLGELAKAALNLPQERFRLSQALVEQHLGEESDRTSLGYLALRLGWLNRVGKDGRGDGIFAFYHATFQEYFAALAVEDWDYFLPKDHCDRPVVGKEYRIFEKQWKQVILCWLGRGDIEAEEKEGFIRALVEFKDGVRDFYGYQAYFLAAAAINEFKTCSLAVEIVRQVVKWGFGYFNIEKQEWWTCLDPIKKGARKAIPETIRPLTISALIDILNHCPDESTRKQGAESLGKIGQGNPEAIAGLLELIRTTEDESTRWRAAESLGKIDPGNPEAIAGLVEVIRTTEDDNTRRQAAESLGKIDPKNPDVIAGLLEVIRTTENESSRRQAAWSLGQIDPGNPDAITGLLEIIRTTESESSRMQAAYGLMQIGVGNAEVIAGLLEVIRTTENESSRRQAAWSLGQIDPGNPDAIASETTWSLGQIDPGNPDAITGLLEIIRTTEVQRHPLHTPAWLQREEAFGRLSRIGQGNPEAIAGLLEVIRSTEDELTRCQAVTSLGKIAVGNPEAIAGLLEVIRTTENESSRRQAAWSLGQIDLGNPEAIAGLLEVIRTTENELTRYQAAWSLGKIDPGNPDAIAGLVEVIRTTEDELTRYQAAESLGEILATPQQYAGVVSALKGCLSNEVYQNNFDRFDKCYEVLWNCAENLSYPEFYQAWHHSTTIPHSEVEDNTPVASTPFTQQCNLALLPQILKQANQFHPLNRQIICIDGSRFSDPSNPALQIYTTLKKAGCPPINDKPRTIAELQAYGEDELSDHAIALILYEEPTDPPPQGFDIAVLNQLARFSHRLATPPLRWFFPSA